MPKTLEELLADTQLTDDIKIALPNGSEVTVKDLRAYAAAQKSATDTAVRDAEARRKQAESDIAKAKQLAEDSLKLMDSLRTDPDKGGNKPGDIDWDNDPVYKPVGVRLSKLEADIQAKAFAEIEKLQRAMAAGFKFVTDDYYERRWNSLPKDARPKDKTWRDYMDDAAKGNIKDAYGLVDPIEAYTRSTAADREAAKIKEAEARGEKRAEEKLRQTMVPRPGATPTVKSPGDAPQFKDLNEAMAAAAQDPEILRIANGEVA